MSDRTLMAGLIEAEGGRVTFARFMEVALTHPTLGYYSRVDRLLRYGGDFSTAPALSPFFCRAVARLVTELLDAALGENGLDLPVGGKPSVVELGGGEGQLAAGILGSWEMKRPDLRRQVCYRLVEVGAGLQRRQAAAVAGYATSGWDVGWGSTLEAACAGTRPVVIVGNEFLDALPVHLLRVAGAEAAEAYVATTDGGLEQTWGPVSEPAAREIEAVFATTDPRRIGAFSADGVIEVSPGLRVWLERVVSVMPSGSLVSIDYGDWFPGAPTAGERWGLEGRLPRRRTVRGFFKHQLVLDPLLRPGRQDLTADVDFAALDLHGREEGFETVLFTTLAAFLRGAGAVGELEELERRRAGAGTVGVGEAVPETGEDGRQATDSLETDSLEVDRQATVLRGLLDEEDLGGAFKLMVQVRE